MADDTAPATAPPLFNAADLSDLLGSTVTQRRARVVELVVWNWLRPELADKNRPNPVRDEIFAWALELGAIAHENPAALADKQLGDASETYRAERRDQILEEVRTSDLGVAPATEADRAVANPQGSFPPPDDYPDPAHSGHPWAWRGGWG